jgi:type II secretory pathway component GspD/PulD (secretin)
LRILLAAFFLSSQCFAAAGEKTFAFTFKEAPLNKVIDYYSAHAGQKFVVDPSASGNVHITIVEPSKVSAKEAFNLLSAALALNSIAISDRNGTLVLASARSMQRSYIPVVTELPPLQPEKLVTWVVILKHADANQISQQVRIMTSKDGELVAYGSNKLLVTDWVSSLYRMKDLIEQIDKAPEAKAAAIAAPESTTPKKTF